MKHDEGAAAQSVEQLQQSGLEKVMQLSALQLSDRWAPSVQRATRPLATRGAENHTRQEGCGSNTVMVESS